jgi:outer membrane lipoprotein-sorting protein
MLRKSAITGFFLALAISQGLGAEVSSAPSKLTAEQVVEKNVAARGGLQSWRAVQTLAMSGRMEAGGNDRSLRPGTAPALRPGGLHLPKRPLEQARLPFRIDLKRGRKMRLELDFRGQTAIQVYDGVNGWKLRPFLNRHEVESYTPDELKTAALQADLDGPLVDYLAKGTKVELEGSEKIEGEENYRLKLNMKNGQTQRIWVNARTFLETKIEGAPRRLDGKYHSVEIYLRDYRSVNGLVVPYLLETKVQGVAQTEKIEIEKVTANPKLEDSRFAKLQ